MNQKKVIMANIMLIAAAAIWGANYVVQKIIVFDIGPFIFMGLRSFLGSIVLFCLSIYFGYKEKKENFLKKSPVIYDKLYLKRLLIYAPFCGLINVFGSVFIQIGLLYTSAMKAGFLTSIYIIFVPLMGVVFFHNKIKLNVMAGIILGTVGLYFLCIKESFTIEMGDLIILASTLMFALHIQLIGKFVHEFEGIHFSCAEFAFASVICIMAGLLFESPSIEQIILCTPSIVFTGIFGIGVCYALQVTAQKYTDPSIAALLMSLEAVFSAVLGMLILGESLTVPELIGASFIFAAVVIAQVKINSPSGKRG